MTELTLPSTLHCPECGFARTEIMPKDQCVWYWQCPDCATLVRPKAGDCCVYCSYGSVPCPSVQQGQRRGCCG
jgi:hypothetical protein